MSNRIFQCRACGRRYLTTALTTPDCCGRPIRVPGRRAPARPEGRDRADECLRGELTPRSPASHPLR